MSIFADYSRYYDLLYRDKDYESEITYIERLLKQYAPQAKQLLELGCGTGKHASLLVQKGYQLWGIDQSETMLTQAESRRLALSSQQQNQLQFQLGDIRTLQLSQRFDAVLSLFHVFSYQVSNQDLLSAFITAKNHLNVGGILLFDCWYGPAVLSDRPTVRVKRWEDEQIRITRIAEPCMDAVQNRVEVNYQVFIEDKQTQEITSLQETHQMRYLFSPEIDSLAQQTGFEVIAAFNWMSDRPLSFDSWNAIFVLRA